MKLSFRVLLWSGPAEHPAQHPVGLWFSALAACGSDFFMGGGAGSQVSKGHSKWHLEEEREAS